MIGDKKATDAIGYRSAWTAGKRLLVYFFKFGVVLKLRAEGFVR